jgi:antibiotic biosynthesis monooxygenase (ABM) superfamily enzyme
LSSDYQNGVTTVICRKIRPGHEKDYNDWVRRYLTLIRKAPGYLGITIIVPGGSEPLCGILFAVLPIKPLWRHEITQKNH